MAANGIKARLVRAHVLEAADAAALQDALNGWLADAGERELLEVLFQVDGGRYAVLVLYTQ